MPILTRVLLLLPLFILIDGCGGGGDSSSSSTYTISGKIEGASGAAVSVDGPASAATTTDASGAYSAGGLPNGQYEITPSQDGSVFDPPSVNVTISGSNAIASTMQRQEPTEDISAEAMAAIDSQPESSLPENEVMLPNGESLQAYAVARGISADVPQLDTAVKASTKAEVALPPAAGPQQKKNDVITKLLKQARLFACGRLPTNRCTTWDYKSDASNPNTMPAQTGLTYIYGGRTPSVRTLPLDGCKEKTYGMDCSGMVSNIFAAVGITAPVGSDAQAKPDNWKFPDDWQLKFRLVNDGTIQSGDLVAWKGHIGIAESAGTTVSANVISSTGKPGLTQCAKNIVPERGPRSLSIAKLQLGKPLFVLRLVTTLTGSWNAFIRCTSQNTDAAQIAFAIDNDQGGPFKANGTGTDYNGALLSFILSGTYDQLSNVLAADLSFTDGTRRDSFVEELRQDDTGYFPLTKVIDNGGCPVSARLVRQTTTAPVAKALGAPKESVDLPGSSLLGGERSRQ